jgi:hypothetical protein
MMLVGMKRLLLIGACLWSWPVLAQPADCPAQPNGPALPMNVWVGINGRPGVPPGGRNGVDLDLGWVPAYGTTCEPDVELPDDVLHGMPAPHGLLQGEGPRDVLHNVPEGQVTVRPLPSAPPPLQLHPDD